MHTADEYAKKFAPHIPNDRAAERAPGNRDLWTASSPFNAQAGVALNADIDAYANEGRWIAACPDCSGAQLTHPADPRFMCVNCGNQSVGGMWRVVRWPKNLDAIEKALDVRPLANQHWLPGESVADLLSENKLMMPTSTPKAG